MSYVYANNDFQGGTLLSSDIFNRCPFIYFNLRNLKDDITKVTFHYEIDQVTERDYNIYAIVLHEKEVKLI